MEMVNEAIAFYSRCAAKADLDIKVLFDISALTVPEKFTGALEVFENVEVNDEVMTIVSGGCFLIKDEISEHAPNASFDYEAKLWQFTDEEFTALNQSIKAYGMKIVFVAADDDGGAGGSDDDEEDE